MTPAEYCLRWNNYEPTFRSFVSDLYGSDNLVDVSLVSKEGELIGAHKVVLSACSSFFQKILQGLPPNTTNPVIVLQDISHEDLQTVLCFMYKGVIRVSQKKVNNILQIASSLQIKGLTGTTSIGDQSLGTRVQSPKDTVSDSNINRKPFNKVSEGFNDINGAAHGHESKVIPRPPRLHSISGNRVPRPQSEPNRQVVEANNEIENEITDPVLHPDSLEFTGTFGDEQLMQALKPEFLDDDYDYDQSSGLQDSYSLGQDSSIMDMQSSPVLFMNSTEAIHQGSSGGTGRVLNPRPKKRKPPTPPGAVAAGAAGGPPKLVSMEDADKRYKCNECGACYRYRESFTRHYSHKHKGGKMFSCDICQNNFTRKDVLKRHISRRHPDVVNME